MTLARTVRLASLIALLSVVIAALGSELFYVHWVRSLMARDIRPLLDMAPEALDHELRDALPLGTPRPAVEAVLRGRKLNFGYVPRAQMLWVIATRLKGSNPFTDAQLRVQFHFDTNDKLQRINSKVIHTGPLARFSVRWYEQHGPPADAHQSACLDHQKDRS